MDLSSPSPENVAFMIEEIKAKLKMAAVHAIKPSHFDLGRYEDIRDLYEHVTSRTQFSISEIESLVTELGRLRKS